MEAVLSRGVERSSIGARPLVRVYTPPQLRRMLRGAGFEEARTQVGVFNPVETPITDLLARRTSLLHSPRVRNWLGHVGGWYVVGIGRRIG